MTVGALLLIAAATTGALTGFAAGAAAAAARLPTTGPAAVAGILAVAVAADALVGRTGRPRPPAVNRQVPQVWSRLFAPGTVAVLYGARLGVGPLTILPTWLWWAAFLVGTAHGPWVGAATGVAFATARVGVTVAAGEYAHAAMAQRMARLRRAEPAVRRSTGVLVAVTAAAVLWLR